jgi:hypothetical protein
MTPRTGDSCAFGTTTQGLLEPKIANTYKKNKSRSMQKKEKRKARELDRSLPPMSEFSHKRKTLRIKRNTNIYKKKN